MKQIEHILKQERVFFICGFFSFSFLLFLSQILRSMCNRMRPFHLRLEARKSVGVIESFKERLEFKLGQYLCLGLVWGISIKSPIM